jgi:hypothetical protein
MGGRQENGNHNSNQPLQPVDGAGSGILHGPFPERRSLPPEAKRVLDLIDANGWSTDLDIRHLEFELVDLIDEAFISKDGETLTKGCEHLANLLSAQPSQPVEPRPVKPPPKASPMPNTSFWRWINCPVRGCSGKIAISQIMCEFHWWELSCDVRKKLLQLYDGKVEGCRWKSPHATQPVRFLAALRGAITGLSEANELVVTPGVNLQDSVATQLNVEV